MKKNFFISLSSILLLITTLTYAQSSTTVKYKLIVEDGTGDNDLYNKYSVEANKGAEKLSFTLHINGNLSRFSLDENMQNRDRDARIAIAWIEYNNVIFYDASSKEISYNNKADRFVKDQEFLIKDQAFSAWKLENEKKEIQGFTCYKATGLLEYSEGGNKRSKKLTAWYCPELSFPFGPKGYGGLPGLILELNIGDAVFGASNITLNAKVEKIQKPEKGKVVNSEQYIKTIIARRTGTQE